MPHDPGKNRPRVTISTAITIDGFLDSVDEERLIISSDQDMEEVNRLRAKSDAILVGAETIRRDDCSLTARGDFVGDDQPLRITVTRSGNIDPGFRFFSAEGGKNLVFCPAAIENELRERLGPGTEISALDPSATLAVQILDGLSSRGVKDLLIEGGTTIITEFLRHGLVDRLRLSIGPFFAGKMGKNRLVEAADMSTVQKGMWRVRSVSQLGDSVVTWYEAGNGGSN